MTIWSLPNAFGAPNKAGMTSLLPMVVTLLCIYLMMFVVQPLQQKYLPNHYLLIRLCGPIATIFLNAWRDGKNFETIYGFLAMINYDLVFMAQGILDMAYFKQQVKERDEILSTWKTPFIAILGVCTMAYTSPSVTENEGFIFFYPLYEVKWLMNSYTLGSFFFVYYLSMLFYNICNTIQFIIASKFWGDTAAPS